MQPKARQKFKRQISTSQSAVEHRPADFVSQPLILQDEFANRIRELFALPTALAPARALTLAFGGGRTRGLDCIGRRTELVGGDMRYRRRLAGGICGVPSGAAQLSCRRHGVTTRRARLSHRDLASRPGPSLLNGLAGPWVRGLYRLKKVQNVFCAYGGPQSQELVIGVRERPPAADGDETGVTVFGKNHGCRSCRNILTSGLNGRNIQWGLRHSPVGGRVIASQRLYTACALVVSTCTSP